ncbi:MAG: S1/P1 nuclease, partial [Gemmatirosa sp.]
LRPNSGGPEARDRALFVRAATLADLVRDRREAARARRYHHAGWHYTNTYWRPDAAGRAVEVSGMSTAREHLVERIDALSAAVRDARRSDAQRAVDLAWLLHLVGDVHQPLHTSSRVTAAEPEGDRGGNAVRLGSTDLHAVWDDAMDRSPGRRPGGRGGRQSGADAKLARAEEWATRLMRAFPADRWPVSVAEAAPARWARESLVIAQRHAYPGIPDSLPAVPPDYRERMRRVAEPQVTLAGYRLAVLLERVLVAR